MARYAQARPLEILYETEGAWIDATAMAKRDSGGLFNRARIRYDNGMIVTVNGASNTLAAGEWLLPDMGWVAEHEDLIAGTVLRDGIVADFSDTGETLFVNARPTADWNLSAYRRIHPSIGSFQQTGARAFRVSYRWDVQDYLTRDYRCFVHFSAIDEIRAQQDHSVSPPTSKWQAGQILADGPWNVTLPSGLADGNYDWLIGLFDATGDGGRVHLQGIDEGSSRIRLGVLHVTNAGKVLTFTAETNTPSFDPTLWYNQHLNNANQVVDFGALRTDGSAWLRLDGNVWKLKTWRRERNFTLELARSRFDPPVQVQAAGGKTPLVTPVEAGDFWRLPLNGAKEYRWTNPPPRLSIHSTNGDVIVSWPASVAGFQLEAKSDLSPATGWAEVTNTTVNLAGQLHGVILPPAGPQQYHRLKLDSTSTRTGSIPQADRSVFHLQQALQRAESWRQ
jgi:hypothetical protein